MLAERKSMSLLDGVATNSLRCRVWECQREYKSTTIWHSAACLWCVCTFIDETHSSSKRIILTHSGKFKVIFDSDELKFRYYELTLCEQEYSNSKLVIRSKIFFEPLNPACVLDIDRNSLLLFTINYTLFHRAKWIRSIDIFIKILIL